MLPDLVKPGLRVVFVGTSVSTSSATAKHDYANPTNKFWQLLAATKLHEGHVLGSSLDAQLPSLGIGLTDLVKTRAASSDALLVQADFDVRGALERIEAAAPQVVAFNGRPAADKVSRFLRHGPSVEEPNDWRIGASRLSPAVEFRIRVNRRRAEDGGVAGIRRLGSQSRSHAGVVRHRHVGSALQAGRSG